MRSPLPIGISSCLLGERVRYDGRLKGADELVAALDHQVRWISICPEVGAGLSTPRPPMDLYQTRIGVRMRTLDGARDVTEALESFARRAITRRVREGACGMIFKSRSPSCGIGDAQLHDGAAETTDGLMVRAVRAALPELPIARDEALLTLEARALFVARALRYDERRAPE